MGRRKGQKSSDSIALRCEGDSSESGRSRDTSQVPEKKHCSHINKAVDQTNIRKHFKISSLANHLKCANCESTDISVCLRCGVSLCTADHAKKHEQTSRSTPHCLMIDTNTWTVWCFKCNASLSSDANKKLRSTGDYVKSHFEKTPAPDVISNVAIPLPPPMSSSTHESEKKLEKRPTNVKKNGPAPSEIRGLANLGNTCFFNSVLQCLAQTPNFVEYLNDLKEGGELFSLPASKSGEEENIVKLDGWGPLTQELARTLSEIKSNAGTVLSPRSLLDQLRNKCSQFRGYEQHDAHELLREILNAVRAEDLKRYQKEILMKLFHTTKVNISKLEEEQKLVAKQMYQKVSDLVRTKPLNVFEGQTECVHECQDCRYRAPKKEPFMDLSLPVLSEKPQPPSCKKNRGDSVSEDQPLSKYQQKKMARQQRKQWRNKRKWDGHGKREEKPAGETSTEKPSGSSEERHKSSGNQESPAPSQASLFARQESGYNSDKQDDECSTSAQQQSNNPMKGLNEYLCQRFSHDMRSNKSCSSLDEEDFFGPPTLFDDEQDLELDTATSKLENLSLRPAETTTYDASSENELKLDEQVPSYMLYPEGGGVMGPFNDPLLSRPNELSSPMINSSTELECKSSAYFNNINYLAQPVTTEYNNTSYDEKVTTGEGHHLPETSELTLESLKQNVHLNREEYSDIGSRSSSLFHESGFCSQSIDEVSSTHPSEGMCSTESCSGVMCGEEFHVENKTSIPESGIGLSIPESDGEANTSPDSMHANRSSGSIQTLSPFSDDSSQRKNLHRSRSSPANLSGDEFCDYQQDLSSPNATLLLDTDYIFEKLNSGRISRRDLNMQDDDEKIQGGDDEEDEDMKNEEEGESKKENSRIDDEYNNEESVGNGTTLAPRISRSEGECSLLSCLNQYTCIELLAGNNKVTCERCTRNQNRGTDKKDPVKTAATLQTLIVSPPPVLICHLKRFQLTYSSLKKISKSVPFPLVLSIGSFCSSKCENIKKGESDVQYSLYGVVEHSGSLHGGHYIAYVKTSSGQWYYASDSRVHTVPESTVLKSEAYLLFYSRIC